MARSIPYQLDLLNWLQFEYLTQVLLRAELGLAVESWGGSADHGADAYSETELNFPNRHTTNPGPFVFQAKFISGANAAGARFEKELLAAVSKEASLIKNRMAHRTWMSPKHYGLFTNAPVTATMRTKIALELRKVLPRVTVTVQGATGVCGLLDTNMPVTRAFPQILSLRSLTELLSDVVRNASIQRSRAVIKEAESLAKVFVPTKAYDQAWEVLGKHNFVVLEGPPEMGKTAIAWMIGAVQLAQKWEAIDCDDPEDFLHGFREYREQVFIADDAFGTTDYKTTRSDKWGRNLHKIIPMLDARHWLVWTSRMHILKMALRDMSLQGRAAKFPQPGEVIVNANRIERDERALILYRHARAAHLEEVSKHIVRTNAASLIDNAHFTPDRIRGFVAEVLPELSKEFAAGRLSEEVVSERANRAIENPTERMQKSFSKLDEDQKWILFSLLDCDQGATLEDLESAFRRFRDVHRPIQEEIQLLREGFLEERRELGETSIDWIHPSYRDLVIQELENDEVTGTVFLEHCSFEGVRLAISVAGGASGQLRFPLMRNDRNWALLEKRLSSLLYAARYDHEIIRVLRMIRVAVASAPDLPEIHARLLHLLDACCAVTRAVLDGKKEPIQPQVLGEFFESTMCLSPPPQMPSLLASWTDAETSLSTTMDDSESDSWLNSDAVSKWVTLIKIIYQSDQRMLVQVGFPAFHAATVERLCLCLNTEIEQLPSFSDPDECLSEASRLRELSASIERLAEVFPKLEQDLNAAAETAANKADYLEQRYGDLVSESPQDIPQEARPRKAALDLERLFSDL